MNRYWGNISLRLSFFLLALLTCLAVERVAIAAQLTVNWGDGSSNEDGFKLERKTGTAGTYTQLATATVNTTTYIDSTLSNNTAYCYRVRAYNTAGDSAYSNEACGMAIADFQAPTVSMTAPTNGITVSGSTVTMSANAADNIGVGGVQFLLDGNNLGNEDTTAPYSVAWNTTLAANGTHTLTAVARDAAGNLTTSAAVTVTVENQLQGDLVVLSFTLINADTNQPVAGFDPLPARATLNFATLPTRNLNIRANTNPSAVGSVLFNLDNGTTTQTENGAPYALVGDSSGDYQAWTPSLGLHTLTAISYSQANLGGSASLPLTLSFTVVNESTPLTLTVAKAGSGSGTITSSPIGISCGADCSEAYTNGTAVALTAIPASGSTFAGWSGAADCSDGSVTMGTVTTCTATFENQLQGDLVVLSFTLINADTNQPVAGFDPLPARATLNFATLPTRNLNIRANTNPSAVGSVLFNLDNGTTTQTENGAPYALVGDSSGDYQAWTPSLGLHTLTAISYSQANLGGSASLPLTLSFTVVNESTPLTLTVAKAGSGSGTITSSPIGISCGADCSEAYTNGTAVALTAIPASGSTFAGWSGAADCSDGSVTMGTVTTCTATFTRSLQVQIGTFRPSVATWYLDLNSNGVFDGCTVDACSATFGISTDRPIVGDWTGIGTIQLGTFDPTTQMWELDRNGNDRWEDCTIDLCRGPFGQSSDLPMAGYWKAGMTTAGIGTFRPSTGKWYLDLNGNGKLDQGTTDARLGPFGTATDKPVVGNWAGNGITRIGVFTPNTGNWQLDLNGNGTFDGCTTDSCRGPFGTTGDLPVAGDWTGTGRTQIGVFTPATGQWKMDINGNGVFDGCTVDACLGSFGQRGDLPVVGKW